MYRDFASWNTVEEMIADLPHWEVPSWLSRIEVLDRPPMPELLEGSAYYPACGMDGRVIQYCGGYCHSFVYVDYGYAAQAIKDALDAPEAFEGYVLHGSRFVEQSQLVGCLRWELPDLGEEDGDPRRGGVRTAPYAYWAIFDRLPNYPDLHGPKRFSLLYIGADGVATYPALYGSHGTTPYVVAVIRPGEGFGGNWANFYDPKGILCRVVEANPGGMPDYLLIGGHHADRRFQESNRWSEFRMLVRFWKTSDGYLGLWRRTASGGAMHLDQGKGLCPSSLVS